jgi:endonuclease/exonuclease/phosphatase family metal-dependent hydrolase
MTKYVCSPVRRARFLHSMVGLIAMFAGAANASAQTTVTLSDPGTHINADQTIQGGAAANTDFSGSDTLASKKSSEAYTRRILFKFDTQNYIPANAVIQSAYLQLALKNAESGESRPLTAYYVTKSFTKGQTTWQQYRDGLPWSTAGGDLGARFSTTWVDGAVGSTFRFDLTSLVQRTVNGEFGSRYTRLALIDEGAITAGNFRAFHSTRATNTAQRPRLVITYTTSTTSSPTPTSAAPTGTTLRVMQWNIHKTKTSTGCDPNRTADMIVAQNPHVVSMNEVNFYSGECAWTFDMGAHIESLLEQKTGVTWYRQNVNAGGVGNVILSRFPPVSSTSYQLSYTRGVAEMRIVVNGRYVNLFSTHVDYNNPSYRTTQINQTVNWMYNFSEPRILMGDFNTWPNTTDYYIVANKYQDAWVAAQNMGTANSYNGTGATHGASRFDYVFYSRVAALSLKSVNVPSASGVSDHDPVVAVFTVN